MATTILPSHTMPESTAGVANLSKKTRRKALKDLSASEINAASPPMSEAGKEKRDDGSSPVFLYPSKAQDKPAPKGNAAKKKQPQPSSGATATDVSELQAMLEKLRLEKAEAEEQVRERDELLRRKDEERGKEQEKLRVEVRKLQKVKKGFNPTLMTIPAIQALKEAEPGEVDESKRKKNKKKDGQEKKIKKPCPAYVLYCKEKWAQVKEAKPQAAFRDVAAEIGAKWNALSADERKPYEERNQQEKEAYLKVVGREKREKEAMRLLREEQMQKTAMDLLQQYLQFRQEGDKEISGASKPKKEKKDPLKPKQPMTAFFHYSSERRAALLGEGKSILEVAKIAAEEWKSMGEDKRAPYAENARQQKEDYLRQIELYKQRKAEEAELLQKEEEEQNKIMKQEALQLLKKKERTDNIIKKTKEDRKNKKNQNGDVDPNKPKKPASSFLLFSKEQRKILTEEKPDLQTSTLNALISVRWKELAEADRQVWNSKAAEAMEAYKKEMEAYNKSVVAPTEQ